MSPPAAETPHVRRRLPPGRDALLLALLLSSCSLFSAGCPADRGASGPTVQLPPPPSSTPRADAVAPHRPAPPDKAPEPPAEASGVPPLLPFEPLLEDSRLPPQGLACVAVEVQRTIDGDTVELAGGQRLRLIGVNTPERGEPLYAAARDFTRAFCAGGALQLCHDVEKTDHYGRALGYLYREGHNLSAELVRRGLAYCYTFYPNVRFKSELLALQRKARAEGLGLWSLPPPAPEPYYVSSRRQVHFHRPSCPSARRISASSRVVFRSREAAFDSGRNPCRRCRP